ncbi:MAG TPA: invasion associated locus B family protein [Rhizomicrobium sp.]|jgi:invasion protein IalB|nr:invasion associated locus B family protein [Rhizomicrobium sp.]
MMKSVLMGAVLGVVLVSGAALAQEAAPDAPPARPDVKTVEDWIVRCFPIQSPSPCDMFQEQDSQQARQRVLSLSIAYVPSLDRHALQVSVPLDVSIPKGLTIQTDSFTSPVLKYRRCDRNGCYVEQAVDNGLVESLAKSGAAGKINIVADNGKSYTLNFSLKGFAAAHDDMVAQARAKAKAVEKSAPAKP